MITVVVGVDLSAVSGILLHHVRNGFATARSAALSAIGGTTFVGIFFVGLLLEHQVGRHIADEKLGVVGESGSKTWLSATAEVAIAEKERPNVVLMDIHLPGEVNGLDASGELTTLPSIPVVRLTGSWDSAIGTIAQEISAHPILGYSSDDLRPEK